VLSLQLTQSQQIYVHFMPNPCFEMQLVFVLLLMLQLT
jgi:hypothetical protein